MGGTLHHFYFSPLGLYRLVGSLVRFEVHNTPPVFTKKLLLSENVSNEYKPRIADNKKYPSKSSPKAISVIYSQMFIYAFHVSKQCSHAKDAKRAAVLGKS